MFFNVSAIVQFLSEHNIAFRRAVEKLFELRNDNFLGFVQLIAKFDPFMQEHLRRIKDEEIHDHYFGLAQGWGTFLAKGDMKPTYFLLYFCESHIIFFNTYCN